VRSADSSGREESLIEQLGILLCDLSRLVGDMVERAVAQTDDMGVVGRADSLDELLELARETDPDVVIVGLYDAELPRACLDLLLERPRVKVIGLEELEGRAQLYELRPEQVEIGEVSPEDVVDTIRAAVLRPTPF
jgi:DNA-binding NarL/FixJ family response regulator